MYKMFLFGFLFLLNNSLILASELKVGDQAANFKVLTHEGKEFELNARKGKWTVLYFYPKAETPGCTKQACAFRDSMKKVNELNADVFGISSDSVDAIKKFHTNHHLSFTLLSDEKLSVIKLYGTKMPIINLSKRWTYIIDPELIIRNIDQSVDPVKDVENVVSKIKELQKK